MHATEPRHTNCKSNLNVILPNDSFIQKNPYLVKWRTDQYVVTFRTKNSINSKYPSYNKNFGTAEKILAVIFFKLPFFVKKFH